MDALFYLTNALFEWTDVIFVQTFLCIDIISLNLWDHLNSKNLPSTKINAP